MTNYSETFLICSAGFSLKSASKLNVIAFTLKKAVKDLKLFSNKLQLKGITKNILRIISFKARPPKAVSLLILLLLLTISTVYAQQSISYALHANIIYRFTKYVEWPNYDKSSDFIIGIVGDTELYDELEHFIENKTVGSKKIVIKKMSSSADSYYCQILFISDDKSKSLKKIVEVTKSTPTLIISESNGLALKGSCINFVIVNDRLKLEINKNNIVQRNLNVANELLSLGAIVK